MVRAHPHTNEMFYLYWETKLQKPSGKNHRRNFSCCKPNYVGTANFESKGIQEFMKDTIVMLEIRYYFISVAISKRLFQSFTSVL